MQFVRRENIIPRIRIRHCRIDKPRYPVPHAGIILDLEMGAGENSRNPSAMCAMRWSPPVYHSKISYDSGSRRIEWDDCGASPDQALSLKEVNGSCYIAGNDGIVLTDLPNTVDLDRKEYWNSVRS